MQSSSDDGYRLARIADSVAAAGLFLILICSTSSIRRVSLRLIQPKKLRNRPTTDRYEDEDGTATRESEAAYSYQLQRVLVLLVSIVCLLASLALCVITPRSPYSLPGVGQWLHFGAWVFYSDPQVEHGLC